MNTEHITSVVKKTAANWAHLPPEAIKLEHQFVTDLGFDSLDQIEMVMEMENEFAVDISDEDAEKVQTVGDAVDLIARQLSSI